MTSRKRAAAVLAAVFSALGGSAWAGSPAGTIEVVQSVPLETTLAVPGIRQTQEVWLEMIRGAATSIDLEQFYVSDQAGEALEPVLNAIVDAAGRGVRVRLLVDAGFYKTYPDSVNRIGATPNCESRTIDFSSYGGIQHAKYFVVDGRDAFVGSQNFDWRALSHIHEIGLRVSDTGDSGVIAGLHSIFERDWAQGLSVKKGEPGPQAQTPSQVSTDGKPAAPAALTLVASPAAANPKGIVDTLSAVTDLIARAKSSVQVQVMEYTVHPASKKSRSPWAALDSALRKAAARGVSVQLMVDVSDLKRSQNGLASLAAVKNVEVRSVTIPPWSGGPIDYARLIHSKYLVVDGTAAWVGSENWSEDYFTQTRNVGLVARDASTVAQLGQVFQQVWGSAYVAKVGK